MSWLLWLTIAFAGIGIIVHLATRKVQNNSKQGKVQSSIWATVGVILFGVWFFTK
ncbi:hypothetical protein [Halobacillus hunanensis]|uniref:hypothetical protein n=1 Tax=Halobacillus hunanensis TaxID=578214 RepID=UPI00158FDC56|nr:hypothetical protein [Halobacillus hunanensis]